VCPWASGAEQELCTAPARLPTPAKPNPGARLSGGVGLSDNQRRVPVRCAGPERRLDHYGFLVPTRG